MLTMLGVGLEHLDIEQVGERYDRRLTTSPDHRAGTG